MSKDADVVYLGLGSNVGRRSLFLAEAIERLDEAERIDITRQSDVYESRPWGVEDQGDFLNMVVEARVRLSPEQLLGRIKKVEEALGRVQRHRWGPREIDIDILLFDDIEMNTSELTLPHPRITERQFVLVPLSEIAPDIAVSEAATAVELADAKASGANRIGSLKAVLAAETDGCTE